jgi:hypothetical protein
VFKSISERSFHLILILDSQSNDIPNEKVPILINLINRVKEMPLTIDIISINAGELSDLLNFKKIAERSGGNLYIIKDSEKISLILNNLAEKKEFVEFFDDEKSVTHISKKNLSFYENFAENALETKEMRTCSICFQKDMNLFQCSKCNTYVHKNCWALWSKTAHIGLPHVFRCHNCFNLLKLDKEFVEMVHTGIMIYEERQIADVQKYIDDIKIIEVESYIQSLEALEGPKVVQIDYHDIILNVEDEDIRIIMEDE